MTPTHVIFIGKPRAGKSTAAEVLAPWLNTKAGDCSTLIKEIYKANNPGVDLSIPEVKEEHRPALVSLGNSLCEQDSSYLVKQLFKGGCNVVAGVRRSRELHEVVTHLKIQGHTPIVIWIDSKIADDLAIADNTEVSPADADFIIDNSNRSKEELIVSLRAVIQWLSDDSTHDANTATQEGGLYLPFFL